MINLAPDLFENMTVIFMDITKCSWGVPNFSNKKNSTDPISNFQLGLVCTYVRMYVCTTDEMTVTFSSIVPSL
jgi:hypothetical protein